MIYFTTKKRNAGEAKQRKNTFIRSSLRSSSANEAADDEPVVVPNEPVGKMWLRSSEALERDWVDGVPSNVGLVFEELGCTLLLQSDIGAIPKKEVPDDEEPPAPFSALALSFLDGTGDLRRLLFMLIIGFNIFFLKNIQLDFL